ncbi:MAG: peptidylprolyl isomerase [Rhizomicrobium sp.]
MQLRKTRSRLSGTIAALALSAGLGLLGGCSWFSEPPPGTPGAADTADGLTYDGSNAGDEDNEAPVVAPAPAKDKLRNDIVAVVNDTPISAYDLDQRVSLIMITSNIPNSPEMRKKVREQALEQLETELIQRQEAQKNDITVSSVEVDKRVKEISEDSRITPDQLKEILGRGHVSIASFRAQIAGQLLWQKAVQQQYAGRISIAPETVDAEMKRLAESAAKVHYVVSEIFVAVDNPDMDDKAHKDAQNYYEQIKSGAPFNAIARQFSQSPSAAQGGSIGVVYDGQLAPELNKALAAMKTGEISPPIRAIGGYYILALQQRLEPYGTKIAETRPEDTALPATLPLARLLLPLPPKASPAIQENAMRIAHMLASRIPNCQVLPKVAKEIQGSVYMNLGVIRLADLSPQIRDHLAKTEPGQVAEPFFSDAGLELFVRCDKATIKLQAFQMPSREQVEQQLFEEQISAMARRYNRDLKRNADIDVR